MKRFGVFTYDQYYPSGGWNDFRAAYDTLDEAKEHVKRRKPERYHIVDFTTGRMAWEEWQDDFKA